MTQMVVNGRPYDVEENLSILQALRSVNIEVPTLCHDERLKPAGACRLCVVEVEGWSHPAISCHILLTDGMVIQTETEALRAAKPKPVELGDPKDLKGSANNKPD